MLRHPWSPHEDAEEVMNILAVPLRVRQKVSSGKNVEGDGQTHQTTENPTLKSSRTLWEPDEEGRFGESTPPTLEALDGCDPRH